MRDLDAAGLSQLCHVIYQMRRLRPKFVENAGDLFADPIWDMMLDLYSASRRDQLRTVTNACIAADVPQTTGLRHIEKLTQCGLAIRHSHLKDRRMIGVELTSVGVSAMEAMFHELARLLAEAGYHRTVPELHDRSA